MSGPVRLSDVARAAGVSLGTASNVFNRPEGVRPQIRERVERAARELGYGGPDPKARVLMGGKVNAVGVVMGAAVVHAFDNVYLRGFMAGVAEVCDERWAAMVAISSQDAEAAARGVRNAVVDGFVIHNAPHIEGLIAIARGRRIPIVAVDRTVGPDVSSIRVDSRGGAAAAARHLLALGHRRFAILSWLQEGAAVDGTNYHPAGATGQRLVEAAIDVVDRYGAFAEVLAEAGIAANAVPLVESYLTGDAPDIGARMILDKAPEATAVLCMADIHALAVIEEAKRRGRSVPRDLSVVGFDDVPEAAASEPPLTTIAQPIREKGRVAARIALDPPATPRHLVLPVELVVRGSTAPPPRE
jgi:DNA-binding LacI/PurR family transcriptional regulator